MLIGNVRALCWKLASGLLYSCSLLRNNNMAINLQMFTSGHGSRVGVLPHVTRTPTKGFFHLDLFFFSRLVRLGYYEK